MAPNLSTWAPTRHMKGRCPGVYSCTPRLPTSFLPLALAAASAAPVRLEISPASSVGNGGHPWQHETARRRLDRMQVGKDGASLQANQTGERKICKRNDF